MRFSTLHLDFPDLDGPSVWHIHPYPLKYSSLVKCKKLLNSSKTEISMLISPGTIVGAIFNNCGGTRDCVTGINSHPFTALSFFLYRHAKFLLRDDTIGRGYGGPMTYLRDFSRVCRCFLSRASVVNGYNPSLFRFYRFHAFCVVR